MSETIQRSDLKDIIVTASEGCADSTRAKLRQVAETTDAVAVGWFHCDGVKCPMGQAGRRMNQQFQAAFDRAMADRFGRKWVVSGDRAFKPFVVDVVPKAPQPEPKTEAVNRKDVSDAG